MKAFLLGAGASRGTFETFRVPVAAEFGETLAALEPCLETPLPRARPGSRPSRLDWNPTKWSLEPVWSCIDYYAKLQPTLPLPRPWGDEGRQIKKAILEVYGQRCDGEASRVKDDSTLAELFRNELQGGDILVSFNYDTIAERLAQRLKRQLRAVPFGCAGDEIRFAKPHGSTSWTLDPGRHPR